MGFFELWTSILYWRRDHRPGRTYTTDTREFFLNASVLT